MWLYCSAPYAYQFGSCPFHFHFEGLLNLYAIRQISTGIKCSHANNGQYSGTILVSAQSQTVVLSAPLKKGVFSSIEEIHKDLHQEESL